MVWFAKRDGRDIEGLLGKVWLRVAVTSMHTMPTSSRSLRRSGPDSSMHGGWVDVRPVSFMFGVEVPQTARESNQGQVRPSSSQ